MKSTCCRVRVRNDNGAINSLLDIQLYSTYVQEMMFPPILIADEVKDYYGVLKVGNEEEDSC